MSIQRRARTPGVLRAGGVASRPPRSGLGGAGGLRTYGSVGVASTPGCDRRGAGGLRTYGSVGVASAPGCDRRGAAGGRRCGTADIATRFGWLRVDRGGAWHTVADTELRTPSAALVERLSPS